MLIYILYLLIVSLLIDSVYAVSMEQTAIIDNKAMILSISTIGYFLQNTLNNPEFWRMNDLLKNMNTQMWGLNGGKIYD
jgi:hypothetical protein